MSTLIYILQTAGVAFVVAVLLFTFKSAGLPILLVLVIQGSVWINFSFPTLQQEPLYFLGYLIVNALQMGANIDYAIVISSHYQEEKTRMPHKEAIVHAVNSAFPTVFTSAPAVIKEFEKTPYAARLKATGVILSYICPLMYMNNPLAGKMPVITCSNKLRTYTTARFYTEEEILVKITKGGN